jgi:hypothetical protein
LSTRRVRCIVSEHEQRHRLCRRRLRRTLMSMRGVTRVVVLRTVALRCLLTAWIDLSTHS